MLNSKLFLLFARLNYFYIINPANMGKVTQQ